LERLGNKAQPDALFYRSAPTVAIAAEEEEAQPMIGPSPRAKPDGAGAPAGGGIAEPGRLFVVSNRVPVPTGASGPSAGGLAVALDAALKTRGGLWFGWSGNVAEEGEPGTLHVHEFGRISYAVADLSQKDLDEYYLGFSNRGLWPVCHYRLDLAGFTRKNTAGYLRVNESLARRLATQLQPDDTIWIHDYHFIPMALFLRQMGFSNRIGFFLHIPWPPPELAMVLPAYETLIRGFAAYDVIGFQTPLDAENFASALTRDAVGKALGDGWYEAFGRRLLVQAFPIGIDTAAFAALAQDAERNAVVRRTRASLEGKELIIGVDRLDYSKGISERIEAFSCFIDANPNWRNQVTFLQITPQSRSEVPEYARMQQEVAHQIGSTNGRFGDVDWTPIRYINKTIGHAALAGLYRLARVGLVTPLRDGMNLVAKEYVAAQSPENPGVLVLSRFAGAAAELDAALIVNPYDTDATAAAIRRALEMPLDERKERWAAMMAKVETNTVGRWCESFLAALRGQAEHGAAAAAVEAVNGDAIAEPAGVEPSAGAKRRPFRATGYRVSH
jgi:trehalose 6-phosphate synthase